MHPSPAMHAELARQMQQDMLRRRQARVEPMRRSFGAAPRRSRLRFHPAPAPR